MAPNSSRNKIKMQWWRRWDGRVCAAMLKKIMASQNVDHATLLPGKKSPGLKMFHFFFQLSGPWWLSCG